MENKNFVLKQKYFLIMLTLYEDEDYQMIGIKSSNLAAILAENKSLWFKVGKESPNKKFETSLKGDLSALEKKLDYLRRRDNGTYVKGEHFQEGFRLIVAELYNNFDIELEGLTG